MTSLEMAHVISLFHLPGTPSLSLRAVLLSCKFWLRPKINQNMKSFIHFIRWANHCWAVSWAQPLNLSVAESKIVYTQPQHLSRRSCPGWRRPHTHPKAHPPPPPLHSRDTPRGWLWITYQNRTQRLRTTSPFRLHPTINKNKNKIWRRTASAVCYST